MHYYDHDHIKNASVKLVIYHHEGTPSEWQICSIFECKHFNISTLAELGYTFQYKYEPFLKVLLPETFYLVCMKYNEFSDLVIDSFEEITESDMKKNPLLGLH